MFTGCTYSYSYNINGNQYSWSSEDSENFGGSEDFQSNEVNENQTEEIESDGQGYYKDYSDLTERDKEILAQANMSALEYETLDWKQQYILESCNEMLDYIDSSYPNLDYSMDGFNRSEMFNSSDRMYLIDNNGVNGHNTFTVYKTEDGIADDYEIVYCYKDFNNEVLKRFTDIYGEGNIKLYTTLYGREGIGSIDLTKTPYELLTDSLTIGSAVVIINSDTANAEQELETIIKNLADDRIVAEIQAEYATEQGFNTVQTDEDIVDFCRQPEMTLRYLLNQRQDSTYTMNFIE